LELEPVLNLISIEEVKFVIHKVLLLPLFTKALETSRRFSSLEKRTF